VFSVNTKQYIDERG